MNNNETKNITYKQNLSLKRQNALKSLNHYISELQMHFDLSEKELLEIIEKLYKNKKRNTYIKKWWHLWK